MDLRKTVLMLVILATMVSAKYTDPQFLYVAHGTGTGGVGNYFTSDMYKYNVNSLGSYDNLAEGTYLMSTRCYGWSNRNNPTWNIRPDFDYVLAGVTGDDTQVTTRIGYFAMWNKSAQSGKCHDLSDVLGTGVQIYGFGLEDGYAYVSKADKIYKTKISDNQTVWTADLGLTSDGLHDYLSGSIYMPYIQSNLVLDDDYVYVGLGNGTDKTILAKLTRNNGTVEQMLELTDMDPYGETFKRIYSFDIDDTYLYLSGMIANGSNVIGIIPKNDFTQMYEITPTIENSAIKHLIIGESYVYGIAINAGVMQTYKFNKALGLVDYNGITGETGIVMYLNGIEYSNDKLYACTRGTLESQGLYVIGTADLETDYLLNGSCHAVGINSYKGSTGTGAGYGIGNLTAYMVYDHGIVEELSAYCFLMRGNNLISFDNEYQTNTEVTFNLEDGTVQMWNIEGGTVVPILYNLTCELDNEDYPNVQTIVTPYYQTKEIPVFSGDNLEFMNWFSISYCCNNSELLPDVQIYGNVTNQYGSGISFPWITIGADTFVGSTAGFYNRTIKAGTYDMNVYKAGYASQYQKDVIITQDTRIDWIMTNWSVHYKAIDEYGNPVESALIEFYESGVFKANAGTTDSNGELYLLIPQGYDYKVCGKKTGYVDGGINCIWMYDLEKPRNLTQMLYKTSASKLHNFSVSVVDEYYNMPLEGAYVQVLDSLGNLLAQGETNANGTVNFTQGEIDLQVKAYVKGYQTENGTCGKGCKSFTNNLNERTVIIPMYPDPTAPAQTCTVSGYATINGVPATMTNINFYLTCRLKDGSGFSDMKIRPISGYYHSDSVLDLATCRIEYVADDRTYTLQEWIPISGSANQYGGACSYCDCEFNISLTQHPQHTITVYGENSRILESATIKVFNSTGFVQRILPFTAVDGIYKTRLETGESYTLQTSASGYYTQNLSFTASESTTHHSIYLIAETGSCQIEITFKSDARFDDTEDNDLSMRFNLENLNTGELYTKLIRAKDSDYYSGIIYAGVEIGCSGRYELTVESNYFEGNPLVFTSNGLGYNSIDYELETRLQTTENDAKDFIITSLWKYMPWLFGLFLATIFIFLGANIVRMITQI